MQDQNGLVVMCTGERPGTGQVKRQERRKRKEMVGVINGVLSLVDAVYHKLVMGRFASSSECVLTRGDPQVSQTVGMGVSTRLS